MSHAVARIEGLSIQFSTGDGWLRAVDGVSLSVETGESLGVVGESGCGKTMTALSMMGLVPPAARVAGSVRVNGHSMVDAPLPDLRRIRGAEVGMVFQEPLTSLHPTLRVGTQVAEALRAHGDFRREQAWSKALDLLEEVGIPDPPSRAREYPHTWSGGMQQRAMIAMALANRPRLLIADEPTTALDVTIQAQILSLLRKLREENDMALILITHDLGVIAEMADRVAVMYAGRIVEEGKVESIFDRPTHPYTRGLMRSLPRIHQTGSRIPAIPGRPPRIIGQRTSCSFVPRCDLAVDACRTIDPPLEPLPEGGTCACLRKEVEVEISMPTGAAPLRPSSSEKLLAVSSLSVSYQVGRSRLLGGERRLTAVEDLSLEIGRGETLALVGESGCGKSTTARALLRLIEPDSGSIEFRGEEMVGADRRELRKWRRQVQAVFQDPYGSLNPRKTVFQIVANPLKIAGEWTSTSRAKVFEMLDRVGLDPGLAEHRPASLSGGQRQRVGIARALILNPALLVLDEPVSALDVSIQAQILNLLADLRDQLGLSYLFIAHDLSVVAHLADRVAVMYMGKIVESGETRTVFAHPAHPYTRALLDSIPSPDPADRMAPREVLSGDVPSILDPPSGCRFRTRCPVARAECADRVPPLEGGIHQWACFFPLIDGDSDREDLLEGP